MDAIELSWQKESSIYKVSKVKNMLRNHSLSMNRIGPPHKEIFGLVSYKTLKIYKLRSESFFICVIRSYQWFLIVNRCYLSIIECVKLYGDELRSWESSNTKLSWKFSHWLYQLSFDIIKISLESTSNYCNSTIMKI